MYRACFAEYNSVYKEDWKMKKVISAFLLILLLCSCACADEWIGGEGWWDDSYSGSLQYHAETGMTFKLPAGWEFKEYDSSQGFYEYADPSGNYTISVFRRDDMGLYDLESYYSFTKDYDQGMIILKDDRDWYIFADAYHMTAYCEAAKGGLFGINLYYSPGVSNSVMARRIISSVDDVH